MSEEPPGNSSEKDHSTIDPQLPPPPEPPPALPPSPSPSLPQVRAIPCDSSEVPVCYAQSIPYARAIRLDLVTGEPWSREQWPVLIPRWRAALELLGPLLGGIATFWLGMILLQFVHLPDHRWAGPASSVFMGSGAMLGCFIVLAITRQSPRRIGLTSTNFWADVAIGIGAILVLYAILFTVVSILVIFWSELAEQESAAQKAIERSFPPLSLALLIPMLIFVGLWEETVFRGFLQTRLYSIFRRWWITIALASVFFGVIHGYQGPFAMFMVSVLAVIMSLLFVWRRSLVPAITFHTLHNLIMFLILRSVSSAW